MNKIDPIMERASESLAKMQYLDCESLCVEALTIARDAKQWVAYCRILLPLQEARRQRRMIAADGAIRLGSKTLAGSPSDWLALQPEGCIVLTSPHDADVAKQLLSAARQQQLYAQVLLAEATDDVNWEIKSIASPEVSITMPAPPTAAQDRWLQPDVADGVKKGSGVFSAADWFVDATEALGDAALQSVDKSLTGEAKVAAIEQCLEVVTDHEILHQRLADAARELI